MLITRANSLKLAWVITVLVQDAGCTAGLGGSRADMSTRHKRPPPMIFPGFAGVQFLSKVGLIIFNRDNFTMLTRRYKIQYHKQPDVSGC